MALPAQENPANTYFNVPGSKEAIDRLKPGEDESPVAGAWLSILGKIFPPEEGYIVRLEALTEGGIPDLIVRHYIERDGQTKEYDFLVVQCKPLDGESQDGVWNGATNQLRQYLGSLKPENVAHRKYGVIAVGWWAKFVEYDTSMAGNLAALNNFHGENSYRSGMSYSGTFARVY